MKIKNRFKLLKEKFYTAHTEKRNVRYNYYNLRDYPFGIMERSEYLTDRDVERIKEKIASLNREESSC